MALDRGVEARRVGERGAVGAAREGLGREPREGRAVAAVERLDRRREVAVDREVAVGVGEDAGEPAVVEPHAHDRPAGVARPGDQGARAQAARERRHALERVEPLPRAGRRAVAGGAQGAAQHGQRVARPGVEVERIGAVEHERAHAAGVPQGERLRREGAVRVAVDVHAREAERVQHGDHVVDRGARAVGVAAAAEQGAAAPHGEPVGPQRDGRERRVREVLERRAVDQLDSPVPR